MCGIAGVIYSDFTRPPNRAHLKAMADAIAHRGPDAEGFHLEPGIGLAHRRLSIIDLAGGDQPMGNEDGSVQVVFNGEIYNHQMLRRWLEGRGHHFQTRSDTEVLVHLYEEDGHQLVERLRGMFAFALWDRKRRRLMLARDRVGIKPLYLYRDSDKLLFGSELKAILAYPGIKATLNPAALEDYITFGMVPGSASIFRQIEKLSPAHVLVVQAETLNQAPRRYWQLRLDPDPNPSAEQWQEALRAKLDETVRLHMLADVPVGAFLSGGLDSSIVVQAGASLTQEPLQTFSIGFIEEAFNELPFARQVAELCGTRQVEEVATPDAVALLDELTLYFDEPFADSSAIPTFLVSRLASKSVKVVLSGDGGDEAFGGYNRYAHDLKEAALRRLLPVWFRRLAVGPMARIWPNADWLPRTLRAKTFLTNVALNRAPAYANTLSLCRPPLRRQLLAPALAAQLNGHDPHLLLCQANDSAGPNDDLAGMIASDVEITLPDDFLVKVDRASMAHGLEVRPPLLDHELLELAARIPSSLKVKKGESKWILKEAVKDRLPADVVRRRKHGFDMPIDTWLRGPLREMFEDVVLHPGSPVGDMVNQPLASKLYRAHRQGIGRHGAILWSLLVLARWGQRYLRAENAPCQGFGGTST